MTVVCVARPGVRLSVCRPPQARPGAASDRPARPGVLGTARRWSVCAFGTGRSPPAVDARRWRPGACHRLRRQRQPGPSTPDAGFTVPPGHVRALRESLGALLGDPAPRRVRASRASRASRARQCRTPGQRRGQHAPRARPSLGGSHGPLPALNQSRVVRTHVCARRPVATRPSTLSRPTTNAGA